MRVPLHDSSKNLNKWLCKKYIIRFEAWNVSWKRAGMTCRMWDRCESTWVARPRVADVISIRAGWGTELLSTDANCMLTQGHGAEMIVDSFQKNGLICASLNLHLIKIEQKQCVLQYKNVIESVCWTLSPKTRHTAGPGLRLGLPNPLWMYLPCRWSPV